MKINKTAFIFPGVSFGLWVGVSIFLQRIDFEVIGLIWFLAVAISGGVLVRSTPKVPHKLLRRSNIIASISILVTVIPVVFFNMGLGAVTFIIMLFSCTFYILFMARYYLPRSYYGYSAARTCGRGNALYHSVGKIGSPDEALMAQSGYRNGAGMDAANPSYGINPANGMAMLATGFDVMGNVYGTNSADDFMHNRGFNGYSDISGFGLSDHHSVDISSSRDWPTHDISTDIHSHNHGMNDY